MEDKQMLRYSRMIEKKRRKRMNSLPFPVQRQASCASVRSLILAVRHGCLLCFDVRPQLHLTGYYSLITSQ